MSQKLLGLSLIALVFILPVGILYSQNSQNSTPKATGSDHPISVSTPYVNYQADDFYIEHQGQRYYFNSDPNNYISSTPQTQGTGDYTTLSFEWNDNGHHFGRRMYFQNVNGTWTVTHNTLDIDSKSFDDNTTQIQGAVGGNINFPSLSETFAETSNGADTASIVSINLNIHPFIYQLQIPTTDTGYFVEMMPAGTANGLIMLSLNPPTGFGYNAILRDSTGSIVTDQNGFAYNWTIDNPAIATVSPKTACLYGIQQPCPKMNLLTDGISVGNTVMHLSILHNNLTVATGSIGVSVSAGSASPTPVISQAACATPPTCGSNEILVTAVPDDEFGSCAIYSCHPATTCTAHLSGKRADFNDDGKVNLIDYSLLAQEFLKGLAQPQADTNCDGLVNLVDYSILAQEFLK